MTNILLTGIPEVGKSGLVQRTDEILRGYFNETQDNISLSSLMAESAARAYSTDTDLSHRVQCGPQGALHDAVIHGAGMQLSMRRVLGQNGSPQPPHTIISTPLTMYFRDNIPHVIFSQPDIQKLHTCAGGIDYVVALTDNSADVASRLASAGTDYPTAREDILHWISFEIEVSKGILPYTIDNVAAVRYPSRFFVIPRERSDATLAKLLHEGHPFPNGPPVTYLAGPISHITDKKVDDTATLETKRHARKQIKAFSLKLEEYAIVINPMLIEETELVEALDSDEDPREVAAAEFAHTVHRDINYFVGFGRLVVAYFPIDVISRGATRETQAAYDIGKEVILIHPKKDKEVFGFRPRIKFSDADEFFGAIDDAKTKDDPKSRILHRFLDPEKKGPRYAGITAYLNPPSQRA